jgi:hypothetical protein
MTVYHNNNNPIIMPLLANKKNFSSMIPLTPSHSGTTPARIKDTTASGEGLLSFLS